MNTDYLKILELLKKIRQKKKKISDEIEKLYLSISYDIMEKLKTDDEFKTNFTIIRESIKDKFKDYNLVAYGSYEKIYQDLNVKDYLEDKFIELNIEKLESKKISKETLENALNSINSKLGRLFTPLLGPHKLGLVKLNHSFKLDGKKRTLLEALRYRKYGNLLNINDYDFWIFSNSHCFTCPANSVRPADWCAAYFGDCTCKDGYKKNAELTACTNT